MLAITEARHIGDYRIQLTFNDGRSGVVDLRYVVHSDHRAIFSPLREVDVFKQFKVDFDTLVWPNGLDLAPEFVYFHTFRDEPELQEKFNEWGYLEGSP